MKVLLASVFTALMGSAAAVSAATSEPRELVFVRGEPSRSNLWTVREDGSGLRQLTRFARGGVGQPQYSPDGTRIVFSRYVDGDDEIYVIDADGRNARALTRNNRYDVTPAWSSDGKSIAFASDRARPGEHEIHVMRANGTGVRRLIKTVNHPRWQDAQFSPTWSPDSKRLIFSMTFADGNPELYVVGVNGKGLRRLTFTRGSLGEFGDDSMPHWASDGRTVLFVSNRQNQSDVWRMNANGSGQRPVVERLQSDDWNPRLAPDGSRIAFTVRALGGGGPFVWVINADGSAARRITSGSEPDWRS
jgi:TolB protein